LDPHLVARKENRVFVTGRDVHTSSIAVIRRFYFRTSPSIAIMQAVHFYASDLPSPTRALKWCFSLGENTLEGISDVDAGAQCTVEGAGQVLAFVHNASTFLRVLLVYTVTRFIRRVATVVKY
jgi:hypothetical protein